MLYYLTSSTWFTKIDLHNQYHQIFTRLVMSSKIHLKLKMDCINGKLCCLLIYLVCQEILCKYDLYFVKFCWQVSCSLFWFIISLRRSIWISFLQFFFILRKDKLFSSSFKICFMQPQMCFLGFIVFIFNKKFDLSLES